MDIMYQVVNDSDEIIGHKLRNEIDFKKDIYRISGLWLTNSKGQVLIAQRLITKDKDPGKWGPAAAGTLEEGETYESNMYKEAEEEIGLTNTKFVIGPKMKFDHPRQAYCQWFTAVSDMQEHEFTPQPEEVEKVRWIDIDELIQDVKVNPAKYVPSMSLVLTELVPSKSS